MGELESLRQKINDTDEELVGLFIKRMELAARVGEYKARNNLKIYDPDRERDIIERFVKGVKADFDIKYVEQFLESLISLSRNLQWEITDKKQEEEGSGK